jgi:hypothetical protein
MSAAACINRWPATTRSPCCAKSTSAQERFEHGSLCLLELEEQRVTVVASKQKQNPGPGADATDTHDLTRSVNVAVAFEEFPPIG